MSAGKFAARWGRGHRAAGRAAGRPDRADRADRSDRSVIEAELISRLRALPGPAPEARFRADLRAQLVAITARVVSESPAETATGSATALAGRRAARSALRTLRRPVLALASASTVLVLLLGMAVWMSSGSLPGQSLYGIKRASENVQLSMAGNDVAKGQAYLQLAGNRVREAADLLSQPSAMLAGGGLSAAGRVNPRTAELVADTLDSADADSVSAMRLLGRAAVAELSKEPLTKMSSWLPPQRTLLTQVRDRIPDGPLHTRAQASLLLLQRIATRTGQLSSAMGCACLAQALADELGPVPCSDCGPVATRTPSGPGAPTVTAPAPAPGLPGAPGSSGGPSGSLPNLSLPPLGGPGSSSSGHAAGPGASQPPASNLPSSPAGTPPAALPSSSPSGPLGSLGPIGPIQSGSLPVTAPGTGSLPALTVPGTVTLPGVIGSQGSLPTLPGLSRP